MTAPCLAPVAMPRAVDLLHQRPDLTGVHDLTDALDTAARWTA